MANQQFADKSMFSEGINRRVEGSYFRTAFMFAARGIVEHSELLKYLLLDKRDYNSFNISREQMTGITKRFKFNLKLRKAIQNTFNVKVVTVLQPVPQKRDYEISQIPNRFRRADGLIEQTNILYNMLKKETLLSTIDLTQVSFEGSRYVDSVHYTPEFNLDIARSIFEKVNFIKSD